MRLAPPMLASAALLSACASAMIGDARAYGRIHDVSVADIHAAIDVDRRDSHYAIKTIYEIEVISADEIHLFHERRTDAKAEYDIMKRVRGTWRFIRSEIIVG
jgi:hypothetical protein